MAYSTGQTAAPSADKKFLDLVITDLISLSYECKRKYPPVKEVCDFVYTLKFALDGFLSKPGQTKPGASKSPHYMNPRSNPNFNPNPNLNS